MTKGVTMRIDGLADLEAVMRNDLTKAAGRGVLRRTGIKAAEPMAALMASLAPRAQGDLAESVAVGTKLTDRQKSLHRKMFRDEKAAIEIFIGPALVNGVLPGAGWLNEFGTDHSAPQPFARPAWDQDQKAMLARIARELGIEVEKAAARARRKAAKAAAK